MERARRRRCSAVISGSNGPTAAARWIVFVLLHSVLTLLLTAQEAGLYRSNDRFLPIEEISEAERSEYRWVMDVIPRDRRVVRELYREGELYRRQVEREDAVGLPRSIETLDADGELLERWRYRYDPKRRLRGVEVLARPGENGLRDFRRFVTGTATAPGSAEGSSRTEDVLQEREGEELLRTVYRYDQSGRLLQLLRYRDEELLEERQREYSSGVLERVVAQFPADRRRVETRYNDRGVPVEESVYEGGRLTRRVTKSYDEEGRLTREVIEERTTRELRYSYDDEGELSEEEELINGSLRRRIEYGGEERRVETRFRGEEPFLRIYFEGDIRLKEEVILDGEVVEVREFEEE